LAAGTREAFEQLLTDDVHWGGEHGGDACSNRTEAGAHYAGLLAAGNTVTIIQISEAGGTEAAVHAVRTGDLRALQRLLADHPDLAAAWLAGHGGRTLLHTATDWPGHFPNVAATIAALIHAGADPNTGCPGPHSETPLHWAASSDDVEAIDALLAGGADINAPGAVIGDGTPLADATAFGQWAAARRLIERGARTTLWEAAALGLLPQVEQHLATDHPTAQDITSSFWGARHGSQLDTAALLLEHGADINWIGWDGLTPLDAARRSQAPPHVTAWLERHGAKTAAQGRSSTASAVPAGGPAAGMSGATTVSAAQGLSDLLVGILLLTMAMFAPWMTWRFLHWAGIEGAAMMHATVAATPIPAAARAVGSQARFTAQWAVTNAALGAMTGGAGAAAGAGAAGGRGGGGRPPTGGGGGTGSRPPTRPSPTNPTTPAPARASTPHRQAPGPPSTGGGGAPPAAPLGRGTP
jgi:hypothetical protein